MRNRSGSSCQNFDGMFRVQSNDQDESKRPLAGLVVRDNDGSSRTLDADCSDQDSGELLCPSQLHGAISFMFQEFATPTGLRGNLLSGEYGRLCGCNPTIHPALLPGRHEAVLIAIPRRPNLGVKHAWLRRSTQGHKVRWRRQWLSGIADASIPGFTTAC